MVDEPCKHPIEVYEWYKEKCEGCKHWKYCKELVFNTFKYI